MCVGVGRGVGLGLQFSAGVLNIKRKHLCAFCNGGAHHGFAYAGGSAGDHK